MFYRSIFFFREQAVGNPCMSLYDFFLHVSLTTNLARSGSLVTRVAMEEQNKICQADAPKTANLAALSLFLMNHTSASIRVTIPLAESSEKHLFPLPRPLSPLWGKEMRPSRHFPLGTLAFVGVKSAWQIANLINPIHRTRCTSLCAKIALEMTHPASCSVSWPLQTKEQTLSIVRRPGRLTLMCAKGIPLIY
ncbi:hypothetical protein BC940DRAFT_100633 [Gongronella butleri]|nr:hypothetical protein BC940DRAFT_100633 [Gongronella butleri]